MSRYTKLVEYRRNGAASEGVRTRGRSSRSTAATANRVITSTKDLTIPEATWMIERLHHYANADEDGEG